MSNYQKNSLFFQSDLKENKLHLCVDCHEIALYDKTEEFSLFSGNQI